ncbi:hypothetical protein GCM10022403_062460 [Streptomyces coacervatus]|uniref:HTH cro/C1-type domain-containing protein n=1 Tax=Streptomyces coacervatus TaxID=647381 RepID=A0ABP7IKJ6_9ACTN
MRLRRLKDHSGLSVRQLAARTGYSPKSWERYLGGRSLPPREAVEALARIGGDDPTRLLALHEVATEAWGNPRESGTAVADTAVAEGDAPVSVGAVTEPEILSAGPGRVGSARSLRIALLAGAVALALAVSSAVLVTVRLMDHGGGAATEETTTTVTVTAGVSAPTYTCHLKQADGRWYAGNSRTRDATVGYGDAGPEVAEVQCLLRRAGISPGGIDGMFGPLTQGAVKRIQQRAGLEVDGLVGPRTWKALRG